jgi:hypothetical protein
LDQQDLAAETAPNEGALVRKPLGPDSFRQPPGFERHVGSDEGIAKMDQIDVAVRSGRAQSQKLLRPTPEHQAPDTGPLEQRQHLGELSEMVRSRAGVRSQHVSATARV